MSERRRIQADFEFLGPGEADAGMAALIEHGLEALIVDEMVDGLGAPRCWCAYRQRSGQT